jgi:hypothetical protein
VIGRVGGMDVREHDRRAWDRMVERRNRWTVPLSRLVASFVATRARGPADAPTRGR